MNIIEKLEFTLFKLAVCYTASHKDSKGFFYGYANRYIIYSMKREVLGYMKSMVDIGWTPTQIKFKMDQLLDKVKE